MDWDKLRIFYAAGQAGSLTHAGSKLGMSQSAVSRQVSALEDELGAPLFHRHARGLLLTEQGELLMETTREVMQKLEKTQARISDSKDKPSGRLRVTTTIGLGSTWLTTRINEFIESYPEVSLELMLTDDELDLSMMEADVAIRLRQPVQSELIQRRLFTVHFHLYASESYIAKFGKPNSTSDLDNHRLIIFGEHAPQFLKQMNWLKTAGMKPGQERIPNLQVNNLVAIKTAVQLGNGIAMLPDYLMDSATEFVRVLPDTSVPTFDSYFVYPAELKHTARLKAFRDFLVTKAESWIY